MELPLRQAISMLVLLCAFLITSQTLMTEAKNEKGSNSSAASSSSSSSSAAAAAAAVASAARSPSSIKPSKPEKMPVSASSPTSSSGSVDLESSYTSSSSASSKSSSSSSEETKTTTTTTVLALPTGSRSGLDEDANDDDDDVNDSEDSDREVVSYESREGDGEFYDDDDVDDIEDLAKRDGFCPRNSRGNVLIDNLQKCVSQLVQFAATKNSFPRTCKDLTFERPRVLKSLQRKLPEDIIEFVNKLMRCAVAALTFNRTNYKSGGCCSLLPVPWWCKEE